MTRSSSPNARSDRSQGQSLVEFALIAPLLFLLLLGIMEGGRFILYYQALNNATRDGARYAIVHGANSSCPSGPAPAGSTNPCDPAGNNVKAAVESGAFSLAAAGDLVISDPVWTVKGASTPVRGDASSGSNARGDYVTVFVDFTYDPLLKQIVDVSFLPTITISAESTLVVNN